MIIGIDLDNIALDYDESRDRLVPPVLERMGLNSVPVNKGAYFLDKVYDIDKEDAILVKQQIGHDILREEKPMQHAVEVLTRLKAKGFQFVAITGRVILPVLKYSDGTTESCGALTQRQLYTFFPDIFDDVIYATDKIEVCKQYGIVAMFDDELQYLADNLEELAVESIVMNKQYNQSEAHLARVSDWLDFEQLIMKKFLA